MLTKLFSVQPTLNGRRRLLNASFGGLRCRQHPPAPLPPPPHFFFCVPLLGQFMRSMKCFSRLLSVSRRSQWEILPPTTAATSPSVSSPPFSLLITQPPFHSPNVIGGNVSTGFCPLPLAAGHEPFPVEVANSQRVKEFSKRIETIGEKKPSKRKPQTTRLRIKNFIKKENSTFKY